MIVLFIVVMNLQNQVDEVLFRQVVEGSRIEIDSCVTHRLQEHSVVHRLVECEVCHRLASFPHVFLGRADM